MWPPFRQVELRIGIGRIDVEAARGAADLAEQFHIVAFAVGKLVERFHRRRRKFAAISGPNLIAQQRTGIRQERARQSIAGLRACHNDSANQQRAEHIAEPVGINIVEPRPWRRHGGGDRGCR